MDNYQMPRIERGELVSWHKSGVLTERTPELAFVKKADVRTVILVLISGGQRGMELECRHMTDPKLQADPEFRREGAWDFTAGAQEAREFREGIEKRVKSLELQLGRKEAREQKMAS